MGESDVKFARYVHKYGSALIHAIDGDYMMIALMYYVRTADPSAANKIHIYRQLAAALGEAPRRKRGEPAPPAKKCWVDMQMVCLAHPLAHPLAPPFGSLHCGRRYTPPSTRRCARARPTPSSTPPRTSPSRTRSAWAPRST